MSRALAAVVAVAATPLLLCGCMEVDVFVPVKTAAYSLPGNLVPAPLLEEISLTASDAVPLAAIWAFQPDPAGHATAVYLHGQAENLDGAWHRIQVLWSAGYNVLAVDYRGFGRSGGTPSEEGLYRDAEATLLAARGDPRIDGARIVIWGFSLGTGVASWLAAGHEASALVLEAPFTSMWALVERSSPFGIPGDWVTDAEFDTLGRIDGIAMPLVVAYGTGDERIPNWMSRAVYDRALQPKRLVRVEGAGHDEVGPVGIGAIVAGLTEMNAAAGP